MGSTGGNSVGDAAATLIGTIAAGEALIALHDQTGSGFITGTSTESEPPWNAGAAYAVLIPHQGLRRLAEDVRRDLGLRPVQYGGSDRNTRGLIRFLERVAPALPRWRAAQIESDMRAWAALGLALPLERLPQWLVIDLPDGSPAPDCPRCGTGTLRVNEAFGVIACLHPYCPSADEHGHRQWAVINNEHGRVSWRWRDGLVQP